jgi:hypothetical protein
MMISVGPMRGADLRFGDQRSRGLSHVLAGDDQFSHFHLPPQVVSGRPDCHVAEVTVAVRLTHA